MLLAANVLITWQRTEFDNEEKSSKFLFEIMTIVTSTNNIGSVIEFILKGNVIYVYYVQKGPENWSLGKSTFQRIMPK